MKSFFTANFFEGNRSRLLSAVNKDMPLFVVGNGTLQRNRDNTFPFRQNSNFWYLTGLDEPDLVLMVHKGESTIIAPDSDVVHSYFEGELQPERIKKIAGVDQVLYMSEAWPLIRAVLLASKQVAINDPDPEFDPLHRIYTNPAQKRFVRKIKRVNSKLQLVDVRKQLMDLRWIKQEPELQAIQSAVDVTCSALQGIQNNIADYRFEYEIDVQLLHEYRKSGMKQSFDSVVGAAERTCILHYRGSQSNIPKNSLVLIDTGAEAENYAADITRTLINAKPTSLQKDVMLAVESALEKTIELLRPGVPYLDIVFKTEEFIGQELKKLGLISNEKSREQIKKYYPHASHFLGLDVHDVGDYRKPLEPGVVLTVEPGIYVAEKAVGVRIEDDIVITENGCEVLSKQLPKHFIVD